MRIQEKGRGALGLFIGCAVLLAAAGCGETGVPGLGGKSGRLIVTPTSLSADIDITNQPDALQPWLLTGTVPGAEDETVFLGAATTTHGLDSISLTTGTAGFGVRVLPKPASVLGNGTFNDVVLIVACQDERCDKHFDGSPLEVPVSIKLQSHLHVGPSWSGTVNSTLGSIHQPLLSIQLHGNSPLGWAATDDLGGLELGSTSGTTPSNLEVNIDPVGLPLGTTTGQIRITETATDRVHTVPITVTRSLPALIVSPEALVFGGLDGRSFSPQRLEFWLGAPPAKAYAWTATVDTGTGPRWLSLSSGSGTFSPQTQEVTASVTTAGLAAGDHQGSITFTASVEGHPVTRVVPVVLRLDSHRLSVTDNGLALVSTPAQSRLTASVTVKDNLGLTTTPWTASSNRRWLSVTASGTSGGTLTVTADPAGLELDAFHQATVTLRSSDASVVNEEHLQVGLWVGSTAPASALTLPAAYEALEADPIRPWVYVHDGTTLFAFHLYTGALITTLSPSTQPLGSMVASSDGSTLYVSSGGTRVVPIDLDTLAVGTGWNASGQLHAYARPEGKGVVMTRDGRAYNAATGAAFELRFDTYRKKLSVAQDSSRFCGLNFCGDTGCHEIFNPHRLSCARLSYSEAGGGTLDVHGFSTLSTGTEPMNDVALSPDGSRVYLAMFVGNEPRFRILDGQDLRPVRELAVDAIPISVGAGPDGRLYGIGETESGPSDTWVYDPAGELLGSFRIRGDTGYIRSGQLEVSGDGKRLAVLTQFALEIAGVP